MPSALTEQDVARLLADPAPQVRAEVASKLAADLDNKTLSVRELQLAHDIVRAMARDVAVVVRRSLADNIKASANLPHDVALRLARDVEEVALPVLEHSPVLTDTDLIEIVNNGAAAKHEAIARRVVVSEDVSEALIEQAGETAVATLVANRGAQIRDSGFAKVVERFPNSQAVHTPLVQRSRLPVAVAERLVYLVAESLRDHLVTHHELPPAVASDMVLQSRERATINLLSRDAVEADVERLTRQLYDNSRLTPSLVLRALCMGDLPFFEAALAVLAGVPLVNARVLIHDAGRVGLKALYDKAGLPPRLYQPIRAALDVVQETEIDLDDGGRERFRARVIERVLTLCEQQLASDDVDYLLNRLGDLLRHAA